MHIFGSIGVRRQHRGGHASQCLLHYRDPACMGSAEIKVLTVCSGPLLERVRRVQLHPLILGSSCMHPSIFRAAASFIIFCQLYLANFQIPHPSIKISNKGTNVDTQVPRTKSIPLRIATLMRMIEYEVE